MKTLSGAPDPREYQAILERKFAERFSKSWYYSIELEPGRWTPGVDHPNIALTRKLLARCQIEGLDCIDVACADGLIPLLLQRRGARRIVGCDRNNFGTNIGYLKKTLGLDLEYLPNIKQPEITAFSNRQDRPGFDVVVNSGLLYHVFNTLGTMAHSRSLVRTGGIMIVETAGSPNNTFAEYFNAEGRHGTDPTTFWYPTIKMVEYFGRLLRLEPIDAVFGPVTGTRSRLFRKRDTGSLRFAMAFRATADYPAADGDTWVQETYQARDYMDLIDWSVLDAGQASVPYDSPKGLPMKGRGVDTMALFKSKGTYKAPMEEIRLPLTATA